jgi:pimeloyl-ACP methyl ester carboxylesterase
MKHVLFGVLSFLFFGFLCGTHTVSAATIVTGTITENTLWTASSSPYIINGKITVAQGVTLTLEAGTVVKLRSELDITVDGALHVEGTENEPVYFTAQTDDSVGGDSNGDGTRSVPASGNWHGIKFNVGSTGIFDRAIIRYAGYGYSSVVPQISSVHNLGGDISIRNSEFTQSSTCAVGQMAGSVLVEHTSIHHMYCGIVANGGNVTVADTTISNTPISFFGNNLGDITLTNNTFENNDIAPEITLTRVKSFVHSGNIISGSTQTGNGLLIRGTITSDMTLTKDDVPYLVTEGSGSFGAAGMQMLKENSLFIKATSTLSIDPGVVIKFIAAGKISVDGTLRVSGTSEAPVYFTSIKDDTIGGDTKADGGASTPASGDWLHAQFNPGSKATIEHAVVRYGGYAYTSSSGSSGANIYNRGGLVSIVDSELSHAKNYGLWHAGGTTTVNQSFIHDNTQYGILNNTQKVVDARNNFWGDATGPQHWVTNPNGTGDTVSDKVLFAPWKTTNCFVNCNSSVLFLPGIQASRLYTDGLLGSEDQLWEPDGNQDVRQLGMNTSGGSINDVYTKEIMTTIPFGGTVYDSFRQFMDSLVVSNIIADWAPFAYDWRYSVDGIAEHGTLYEAGIRDLVDEIERLVATSRTGKVTIIGHSNGGLLAKAIMLRLEREGKANLVDKVVLLASPQLGTPKAVGTILHGYDQEKLGGWVIDDAVARDVIQNMPGAYGLIPTQKYFDATHQSIVTFDSSASTNVFRTAYGSAIDSEAELQQFMNGVEGRADAVTVDDALKSNSVQLNNALNIHRTILDNWVAPVGVTVVEVVGLGLDTVRGFEYRGFSEKTCTLGLFCSFKEVYKPVPIISQYGDKTVVGVSAEGYRGVKEKYFVNLLNVKRDIGLFEHYNITETIPIQSLLQSIFQSTTPKATVFVSTTTPSAFGTNRIMFGAHSPVQLEVTDSSGKKVSFDRLHGATTPLEQIPNSTYLEVGDSKYVIVPDGVQYDVTLKGTALGALTFSLDTLQGETQIKTLEVKIATITASTTVRVPYAASAIGNLTIDTNNDGKTDILLSPTGVDITPVISKITYATLKSAVQSLSLSLIRKAPLLLLVATADSLDKQSVTNPKLAPLELLTLNQLEALIIAYQKKGWITQVESSSLIVIINKLK